MVGLALPHSATAQSFICTAVPDSSPQLTQVWNQRCLPYFINNTTGSNIFEGDARKQLVAQSFAVWSGNNCTDLSFLDAGESDQDAGFNPSRCDNKTVVLAVNDRASLNRHFDGANLLAVTLTSFSLETGEIFDADILANDVGFEFDDVSDPTACRAGTEQPYDLRNTLVHEMGHFIGFDHTSAVEATMFASAPPCEIKKRDLEQVDIDGVCSVYPAGGPPRACAAPPNNDYDNGQGDPTPFRDQCNNLGEECTGNSGCSCAAHPRADTATFAGLWLFLGLIGLRRFSGR